MKVTTLDSTGVINMKYGVGCIIKCTQPGSSRHNAIGVVFFADERGVHQTGVVRYRVNWFISPAGYIRGEPDIGEYKSDWLENNSELWNGVLPGATTEPYYSDCHNSSAPDEHRGRYMCLVENGKGAPKIEHQFRAEAKAEAERLAKAHGGTVRVLEVVASVQMKRSVQYTPQWDEE